MKPGNKMFYMNERQTKVFQELKKIMKGKNNSEIVREAMECLYAKLKDESDDTDK